MGDPPARAAPVLTVTPNPAIDRVVEAPDFVPGSHVRVRVRRTTPAGKGINVARGIRALGGHAEACAFVGRAEEARYSRVLRDEGISDHLVLVDGPTRLNTTILDTKRGLTSHLREEGFHVSGEDIQELRTRILDVVARMGQASSVPRVAFCGSLPPGFSSDALISLLRAAREAGARVVLDTGGPVLRRSVQSGLVDVVKPNLAELEHCLDRNVSEREAPEAATELLGLVDRVLITLGSAGAWHVGPEGMAGGRCRLPDAEVRNTVGGGDAFLSGWLAARSDGCGVEEALKQATAAGSAAVTCESTVGHTAEMVDTMALRYERLSAGCGPSG